MTTGRLGVWPPLPLGVHMQRTTAPPPFPLTEPGCRLYSKGRQALWHGLQAIGLAPGDEILMPAYNHGSEVEVLLRLGLRCVFYDVAPGLAPDSEELETLIGRRTRALYVIHYLGLPQDCGRWRNWAEERGLFLIEDAAQALLARSDERPVGSFGRLAIYCLYKTFGLPDGAALLCEPAPDAPSQGGVGLTMLLRRHGAWIVQRSNALTRVYAPVEAKLDEARQASWEQTEFELDAPGTGPAAATLNLLSRIDATDVAATRRAHYRKLLHDLGSIHCSWFPPLSEGASPFAFPVWANDKPAILRHLWSHRVMAVNLWSVSHPSIDGAAHPNAERLRRGVIGLPVHHELRPSDLQNLVEVMKNAVRQPV